MGSYESREYCKDIECIIQKMNYNSRRNGKNSAKKICKDECKAYDFHKWLQKNDYTIVNEYALVVLMSNYKKIIEKLFDKMELEEIKESDLYDEMQYIDEAIKELTKNEP